MLEEVIIAGFGGQGVMLMGRLLAYAGMLEGKNVAWMPSYGPEMRGGTANCTVIISSEEIASPVVPYPKSIIVMNKPSLDKFEATVQKDGLIILNESLIDQKVNRDDVAIVRVPANDIANQLGNLRVANMVALGAYIKKSGVVKLKTIFKALEKTLAGRNQKLIDLNKKALKQGEELGKEC
ncbi:MAG: 2-oxoacid:ferredoxin oxidoreductase subunit gamma [Candidatus Infernicultor aquiphilus]|uniref:2-oxoacid:ferredoxin oxidoreductase subunit gamma n=1 Tax=Candidatus Infernicultor aquiphilus TaxID=1805029 RepID=A0A1J5GBG5_9BACT|nr:2-oxoacid:ferredoxin oxidoreductase subunit gamma [bacterium]OIP66962.1 MAG: 2-oxoacid:ferredoxin oxidoreductase subunit gamma [Candidatus Atribacteria bacterium CG2_30_33_13]PIU25441.1 MAG: 2-oxoacid:ferredoxin oxidoreductase subunit gamma [Candidatus Atribacteria bacterium CG08_land_8_20_14_0_20_33_29]PIW11432.1 MAG: 2-oxoacid:ferredoxin oxidoreductase subunit gamma [Candidatus Atribacteria bacterium CG17_big_fil_post_rev_8_21_14_2_50_34_11]PIX35246.1 MAG: 2-oxoacid:ferredoxin oxidoreducta